MTITRFLKNAAVYVLLILALALTVAAFAYFPVEILSTLIAVFVWNTYVWPYVRSDGPRHMVYLADGSRPFYDRRGQAVIHALWGYARDPNRKINGFPFIETFWESHLPNI